MDMHFVSTKAVRCAIHDIMAILAKYGSTDGLSFDHYETDWDFG